MYNSVPKTDNTNFTSDFSYHYILTSLDEDGNHFLPILNIYKAV